MFLYGFKGKRLDRKQLEASALVRCLEPEFARRLLGAMQECYDAGYTDIGIGGTLRSTATQRVGFLRSHRPLQPGSCPPRRAAGACSTASPTRCSPRRHIRPSPVAPATNASSRRFPRWSPQPTWSAHTGTSSPPSTRPAGAGALRQGQRRGMAHPARRPAALAFQVPSGHVPAEAVAPRGG